MKLLFIPLLISVVGCSSLSPQQTKMTATLLEWTRPSVQSTSPIAVTNAGTSFKTTKSGFNTVIDPESTKYLTSGAVDLGYALAMAVQAFKATGFPYLAVLSPIRNVEKVVETQIEASRDIAIVSAGTENLKLNEPQGQYTLELGWVDNHPTLKLVKNESH